MLAERLANTDRDESWGMFIERTLLDRENPKNRKSPLKSTHQKRGVVTAKSKRVRQRGLDFLFTCDVRGVIEIALGILIVQIDRWRNHAVIDCLNTGRKLNAAGCTEKVSGH